MYKAWPLTEYDSSTVRAVQSGAVYPIREFDRKKLEILAAGSIGEIAYSYCGADIEVSTPAIKECVLLLIEKFSGIGIDEVREAFKLAAAKQIDANLAAYSGQFTVKIFGEVMAAYIEYRRPIFAEIKKQMEVERMKRESEESEERNSKFRGDVVAMFHRICQGKEANFLSAEKIPGIWAKFLVDEKLVFGNPSTWVEAKKIVVERFIAAQKALIPDETISVFDAKQLYYKLESEPDIFPTELRPRAELLYGRMIVWEEIQRQLNRNQPI